MAAVAAVGSNDEDERVDEDNGNCGNIHNDNNDGDGNFNAMTHRYFLQRLGLIADEVDWPANITINSSTTQRIHVAASAGNATDTRIIGGSDRAYSSRGARGGGATSASSLCSGWRARDALTSILGEKACMVKSDSGLTAMELLVLENKIRRGEGLSSLSKSSPAAAASSSAASSPLTTTSASSQVVVSSVDSILASILNPEGNSNNLEAPMMQQLIKSEHVRKAFDAAAYAILRGECRRSQQPDASSSNAGTTTTASSCVAVDGGLAYDPPLVLAMEAIRRSRIAILTDASSGSCKSVPPFLKKNHTIPWFHVPVNMAGGEGGAGLEKPSTKEVSTISSSLALVSPAGGIPSSNVMKLGSNKVSLGVVDTVVDMEKKQTMKRSHQDDGNEVSNSITKRIKLAAIAGTSASSGTSDKEKKKQSGESGSGGKKVKKDKIHNGDFTTTSKLAKSISEKTRPIPTNNNTKQTSPPPTQLKSLSTSKHQSISPTGYTTKKYSRLPSSTAAEDAAAASSSLSDNPAITRAIVSGAALKLFREYAPDFDGGDDSANATAIMSTIIHGTNLVGTASERDEPTEESPMQASPPSTSSMKITDKISSDMKNVNMQDIVSRATTFGLRVWNESRRVARQWDQRLEFRLDSALSRVNGVLGDCDVGVDPRTTNPFLVRPAHTLPLIVPNSFVTVKLGDLTDESEGQEGNYNARMMRQGPSNLLKDNEWTESCLPRLLDILSKGAGHAIVHDMEWMHRAGRVANMLETMARSSSVSAAPTSQSSSRYQVPPRTMRRTRHPNFGPHLIVTSSGEDFDAFSAEFGRLGGLHQSVFSTGTGRVNSVVARDTDGENYNLLRILPYHGSKVQRRQLRKHFGTISPSPVSHFSFLGGLPDSPFHVVLTTYSELMEDYAHFCHIPFQVVILDDGLSCLGCSYTDPHGDISKLWNGLWSKFDFGLGSVGVTDNGCKVFAPWDFSREVSGLEPEGDTSKNSITPKNINATDGLVEDRVGSHARFPIGLTARHRILLASGMHTQFQGQAHKASVLGLLSFLAPQFADAIIDDWEQSRDSRCKQSMSCLRSMIARLVVVYSGDATVRSPENLIALSLRSLNGELPLRSYLTNSNEREGDGLDELVRSQKIVHSQKIASSWFPPTSSIRKEIQMMSPKPLLAVFKRSNATGFFCEEITTASCLTTAGATGCVVGLSAYRAAVRCGRCFTSESGLKQHIISSHALPGTWVCRYCRGDCGSSQARSHHERACRVPRRFCLPSSTGSDVAPSSVGKGGGKQPKRKEVESSVKFAVDSTEMKIVTGHAGVWLLANGKFVVKVEGKLLVDNESERNGPLLFDTAELASKKFDQVSAERAVWKLKMTNPQQSKSRNILAGNKKKNKAEGKADIVTPDLSVIDIKKLPPHVKPLLRDPNFTSRTGGNSKRYVYAYRGVCRQERKGHERWQSQISFNGQNHYLGTFDSEWDAAAVYAWAHLILYGEEATKNAQREGEEAAAAFKQNLKEIAEGRTPAPSPKPAVKKKRGAPKKKVNTTSSAKPSVESSIYTSQEAVGNTVNSETTKPTSDIPPKAKIVAAATTPTATSVHGKKKRPVSSKEWSKLKMECAMMLSSGTKGTSKASVLATRKDIADMNEQTLLKNVSDYTASDSISSVSKKFLDTIQSPGNIFFQLPATCDSSCALPMRPCLIGLRASDFGWDVNKFMDLCQDVSVENSILSSKISFECGIANTSFFAFVFSSPFSLGRASKESNDALVLNSPQIGNTLGMPVGNLDCNVGGLEFSCSEMAAKILCVPLKCSNFQFIACNDDDIITLNGRRLYASMGPLPLRNRDICSVGARVFIFVETAVHKN